MTTLDEKSIVKEKITTKEKTTTEEEPTPKGKKITKEKTTTEEKTITEEEPTTKGKKSSGKKYPPVSEEYCKKLGEAVKALRNLEYNRMKLEAKEKEVEKEKRKEAEKHFWKRWRGKNKKNGSKQCNGEEEREQSFWLRLISLIVVQEPNNIKDEYKDIGEDFKKFADELKEFFNNKNNKKKIGNFNDFSDAFEVFSDAFDDFSDAFEVFSDAFNNFPRKQKTILKTEKKLEKFEAFSAKYKVFIGRWEDFSAEFEVFSAEYKVFIGWWDDFYDAYKELFKKFEVFCDAFDDFYDAFDDFYDTFKVFPGEFNDLYGAFEIFSDAFEVFLNGPNGPKALYKDNQDFIKAFKTFINKKIKKGLKQLSQIDLEADPELRRKLEETIGSPTDADAIGATVNQATPEILPKIIPSFYDERITVIDNRKDEITKKVEVMKDDSYGWVSKWSKRLFGFGLLIVGAAFLIPLAVQLYLLLALSPTLPLFALFTPASASNPWQQIIAASAVIGGIGVTSIITSFVKGSFQEIKADAVDNLQIDLILQTHRDKIKMIIQKLEQELYKIAKKTDSEERRNAFLIAENTFYKEEAQIYKDLTDDIQNYLDTPIKTGDNADTTNTDKTSTDAKSKKSKKK